MATGEKNRSCLSWFSTSSRGRYFAVDRRSALRNPGTTSAASFLSTKLLKQPESTFITALKIPPIGDELPPCCEMFTFGTCDGPKPSVVSQPNNCFRVARARPTNVHPPTVIS
uniref:(northern house mosquito) hypothetical protein n=1 Tax=Culex pipiens TaxID=7175 RepID=A0A8D8PFP2_CULPI